MKPLASNPKFAEASTEINALAVALGKIQGRINEIESLLRTAADFDADSAHVDAALRFVETGKVEGYTLPGDLQAEHALLRTQRDKAQSALAKLQQARHGMAGELSIQVCKDAEAAHKKLAARALEKLLELDAIVEEEMALVRSIESAGYSVGFREYVRWPLLGTLSMGSSEAPIWSRVRELQRYAGKA